ncbi:MAG: hypothetical protein R3345_12485 [Fulvivirga sp.]|nr:hypothetical protein [Fulvivirga sp.]
MIGFFEHQYLSFKKNHLRNLIALARADGNLHKDEEKMLYKIGEKYGLKDRQIASLIRSNKEVELKIPQKHEQKMNQLYDLVMMVYADGVVDDNEVKFCEDLMEDFGFKKEVVHWMIEKFDESSPPAPPAASEWDAIVKEGEKFEK